MNAHAARESHLGPPSEPVDVAQFIQSAVDLGTRVPSPCDVFSFVNEELVEDQLMAAECT